MKFLIDAQLPRRLVRIFLDAGYEAIHTLDLPQQNQTRDTEINRLSIEKKYIVVTKDKDFFDSFYIFKMPYKLLLVTTGNIKNNDIITLFSNNLETIAELFEDRDFIELSRDRITVH
ncbi:DUF5615 family PIN-like protein [Spirulina sp. 06S082]|uniref:DUF5615 family PIN-like protein n=1 Tax=Spirulina sp. 06S082 TaxID=3110248 RepID=UPI002B20A501|nr:DUF5615 family PIN-like protein [Spirulina sp. 06S082]MEA5467951.1 DUF5615 family PIN-like protein [Spirulina sp. 06S082]